MPITVNCACGKVFRVRDEQAGQTVTCQVCGSSVTVGDAVPPAPVPIPAAVPQPLKPAADKIPCPACAEQIPRNSIRCPMCKEPLRATLTKEELAHVLQGIRDHLEAQPRDADADLKGGFMAGKTIVAAVFTAIAIGLIVWGASVRDGDAQIGFGVIFGIVSIPCLLISLAHDYSASHIQDAQTAEVAFKRFLSSVRTGRVSKAFAALSPNARTARDVETIKFKNPKIEHRRVKSSYRDPKSYMEYWKTILKGPGSYTRYFQPSGFRVVEQHGADIALVEMRVKFTSYNNLLLLTILISWIITVILILILQQKDELTVHKALIRHNGKWYLMDGAWEGELDRTLST